MDTKQAAQDFLEKYTQLRRVANHLEPVDRQIAEDEFFSSDHMKALGIFEEYEKFSAERSRLVSELKQIRTEVGDEALIAELKELGDGQQALEYMYQTAPREEKAEFRREVKKGLFGRFR